MQNNARNPRKISVIITAYNRTDYILDAMQSVLNQTLSRDNFEVIVIKNFSQPGIDEFIAENKFKNVDLEGFTPVPEMIWKAINYSNYEILSFLDDDDMYSTDKLEKVFEAFNEDNELAFLHNSSSIFYDKEKTSIHGPILQKKSPKVDLILHGPKYGQAVIYYDAAFNMSSISVSKDAINMQALKSLLTNPDMFMLFSSMKTSRPIMIDSHPLTLYRIHDLNTSVNQAKDRKAEFRRMYALTYYQILEIIKDEPYLEKLLNIYMVHSLIELHIANVERGALYLKDMPMLIQKTFYIFKWEPEKIGDMILTYVSVFLRSLFPKLLRNQILHS